MLTLCPSGSEADAEQTKEVPTTRPLKGLIDTLDTLGARLLSVFEPESLSLPPLVSVTVAVQVMLSPTLAVEEFSVNV